MVLTPSLRSYRVRMVAAVAGSALFVLFFADASRPASAQTYTSQSVAATSVVFYPGDASSAASAGGTAPPTFSLNAGTGRILTFSSVTGSISFNIGSGSDFNDPDGVGNNNSTNISSANSISGISFSGRAGYLVGVFLNGSPSGSAPASLSYSAANINQTSYSPLIDQTFFIGDGLTGDGSGTVQNFFVPDTATTLVLGFADAPNYNGSPGSYGDNSGSFSASFKISGTAAPEPNSVAFLLAAGLPAVSGIVAARRRARRSA